MIEKNNKKIKISDLLKIEEDWNTPDIKEFWRWHKKMIGDYLEITASNREELNFKIKFFINNVLKKNKLKSRVNNNEKNIFYLSKPASANRKKLFNINIKREDLI